MRIQVRFKLKTLLAMLLAVVVMNVCSLYFFTRVDTVVHSDLYRYGLQFSDEWTRQYWTNSSLLVSCLMLSIIFIGISIAATLIHARKYDTTSKFVCFLSLIAGTTLTISSAFFFSRLDYIVHHDLYQYGLQFSYEWAVNYWIYSDALLGLIGLSTTITLASMSLVFLNVRKKVNIDSTKLIYSILITTGIASLVLSIVYSSSILAFVGLGLTFWGIILIYIRTDEYIKKDLFNATAKAPLSMLNQMIQELEYKGKAVYLPPKYLKNLEDNKAFLPENEDAKLPTPQHVAGQEPNVFIENPHGILLTPPGAELARLFEKRLETSFTRVDLRYLQQNMPKLLIEDLEIAQNFDMEIEHNKVRVKIENSPYGNLAEEVMNLHYLYKNLGCPLSSAIACALAKATGKPIIIENQQTSDNGKNIEIEYRILEEEQTEG